MRLNNNPQNFDTSIYLQFIDSFITIARAFQWNNIMDEYAQYNKYISRAISIKWKKKNKTIQRI